MSFRANLQYLRAQRNMPQEQLAMLLGVSRQAISKWESEKAYPEMDKLLMICDLFGCALDDLVLGDVSASVNVGAAARGAAEGDHGSAARTVTGEGAGEPAYMKDADGNIGESARSAVTASMARAPQMHCPAKCCTEPVHHVPARWLMWLPYRRI